MSTATLTAVSPDIEVTANCSSTEDGNTPTLVAYAALAGSGGTHYIYYKTSESSPARAVCTFTDMPTALAVVSVTIYWHGQQDATTPSGDETRGVVRISGANYYTPSVAAPASWTQHSYTWTNNPATGLQWTTAQVDAAGFGVEVMSDDNFGPIAGHVTVSVDYTPLPPDQAPSRDSASRKLYLRRIAQQSPQLTGGLWLLDLAHHTQVDLHHLFGVSESGLGWEPARWKRGLMTIHQVTVDPMANTVTLGLRNDRRIRCLMYDSGYAKQGGPAKNGLMRFSNGATWTFTRASAATFTDVAGDSVTVQSDVEAYAADGQEFLAAAGARAIDRGYWSNNTGARTWCAQQQSSRFEVTPDWNAAAVVAINCTVAYVYHDANNYAWTYFDGPNARWVFEEKVAGVVYRAVKSASPVANTRYLISVRKTGSRGELGLTAYTASIFVDGVKGTDVVPGAAMTEAGTSTFDIGTKAGTDPFKGKIRRRISRQIVLTDTEMARSF
jgi:hypothetical protein